jgi:ferric enterobactin receptor
MRAFLITLGLLCFSWLAAAQIVVTAQFNNTSITTVLNDWSQAYDVEFAFDSYELAQYSFTGNFTATPLDVAITQLLSKTPFRFRWLNSTCIIFPAPAFETVNPIEGNPSRNKTLSGRISDRLSKESLPFASVAAVVSGMSAGSDAEGTFHLFYDGLVTSDTLVVLFLGYTALRIPFNWNDAPRTFNLELVPANELLPDVEIRATSVKPLLMEPAPSVITINPGLSGLLLGVGEADVFRPAQFAPGVSAVQENSNGLFIRGSSSDQSQLLFDGFNVYHQDHFFGMFPALNAQAVKSMRVHKCLVDPEYGGRAAGVLEVIGKEGDLRKPSGHIELGTMSLSGAFETPLDTTDKASLFVCGRRSITDWLKGPAYKELFQTLYSASIVSASNSFEDVEEDLFDPQLLFQDLHAKFTYRPSQRNHFNASFYASRDELSFNYADTSRAEIVNASDIRYSDEASKINKGAAMRWIFRPSKKLEALTSVGFSSFQGVYFSTDSIRNNLFATDSTRFSFRDVVLNDWSVLHRWNYRTGNHTWKAGLSFNRMATSEKARESGVNEISLADDGLVMTLFVGDEWRFSRWLLQSGLRANAYVKEGTQWVYEPKLAVRYDCREQELFWKMAVARSAQFVQRITNQSLYQNVPDQWQLAGSTFPILKSDQVMVGFNFTFGRWNLNAEAYMKQTVGQVLNAAAGQYTNTGFVGFYTGQAQMRGLDIALQWERPPHRVMTAFSGLKAESSYEGFEQLYTRETYNRAAEGKVVYEWKKRSWNASLLLVAAQGSPYTALIGTYNYALPDGSSKVFPLFGDYNGATASPYVRVDVSAGYQWQWESMRLQLGVSIYNLLDTPNYRSMQYSAGSTSSAQWAFNERPIQMLGRIPSITLTGHF